MANFSTRKKTSARTIPPRIQRKTKVISLNPSSMASSTPNSPVALYVHLVHSLSLVPLSSNLCSQWFSSSEYSEFFWMPQPVWVLICSSIL